MSYQVFQRYPCMLPYNRPRSNVLHNSSHWRNISSMPLVFSQLSNFSSKPHLNQSTTSFNSIITSLYLSVMVRWYLLIQPLLTMSLIQILNVSVYWLHQLIPMQLLDSLSVSALLNSATFFLSQLSPLFDLPESPSLLISKINCSKYVRLWSWVSPINSLLTSLYFLKLISYEYVLLTATTIALERLTFFRSRGYFLIYLRKLRVNVIWSMPRQYWYIVFRGKKVKWLS